MTLTAEDIAMLTGVDIENVRAILLAHSMTTADDTAINWAIWQDLKGKPLIPALVEMGKRIGVERLLEWQYESHACCCMGPKDGDPLCGCQMSYQLQLNLVRVLNEIDPDAALKLLRTRIVEALR